MIRDPVILLAHQFLADKRRMQYHQALYAFVYADKDGIDKTLIGYFNEKERPLMSNCSEEITKMSYAAIEIAAKRELKIRLVKYQKEHEIDFSRFVES
ncbi:hypothetical protein FIV04_04980 [Vibrio sp. THAF190c]|nr:hypothetical protein FIV04_04980 [Vibrio sp. THAF190c]